LPNVPPNLLRRQAKIRQLRTTSSFYIAAAPTLKFGSKDRAVTTFVGPKLNQLWKEAASSQMRYPDLARVNGYRPELAGVVHLQDSAS